MRVIVILLSCLLLPEIAFAHDPLSHDREERVAGLASGALLAIIGGIYLVGTSRVRPKLPLAFSFIAAFVLCVYAVLGPLDRWAEENAAAHMSQHMLLMVVIAPLWVLSRPLPQLTAGGGRFLVRLWKPALRLVRFPMVSAYLHGAIIWLWHIPYFYLLALENPWWHVVEHACFLLTAGIFWWAVLKSSHTRAPWALLAVLFTLMHTGFLGALLTFASFSLYGEGRGLADQQLAGLIMWVACAIPYLTASAWISLRWYRQLQRRMGINLAL